ncbi:hypothetical protein PPO43_13870 [Saprospira sp. CCB-QB6]|uniref:hypothetical protein n=1 Tax=Saprospira sp. CCB-QB6 TaxID=3023936 RepID=UPI00234BAA44|nr:hypothetical protein [Saprospira sp. CCB-QB6]WCL81057.1 hypothetical protein PPO43_13870 [Saprospira sp. CCB-QB6]
MRTTYFFSFLLLASFLFSACNNYKSEYEQLLDENAAIQKKLNAMSEEDRLIRGEYSETIETLNAIEDTLRAIETRDKEIQKLSQSKEMSGDISQRQTIIARLQALKDANEKSNGQARQMQARLNSFRIENEQLRKMISQAETKVMAKDKELEEAQGVIDGLRTALSKMESQLLESEGNLAEAYEELKTKNEDLESTNRQLTTTIEELNRKNVFIDEQAKGYVACGSKKTLRRKGILSRFSMKLTKQYQSAVRANSSSINYFESNQIECGTEGDIIAVLPARPESSYTIKGNRLEVNNAEEFWKTDKIVVIVKD